MSALQYDTENKRAALGQDASPAGENTEYKRAVILFQGTDENGNPTPYLVATSTPGVYEIANLDEVSEFIDETIINKIDGITKSEDGLFYVVED